MKHAGNTVLMTIAFLIQTTMALEVELGKSAWVHNDGGGWNYVTSGGCSGWQLHKLPSGRELDMVDRGNQLTGSMKATFSGPDGKYDIAIVLRAWSNCCAKWAVSMNGQRLGGGDMPMTKNCARCERCDGNCLSVSVAKGVTVKKGATLVVWGQVAWPCSGRGGSYPTFQSVKLTGGATKAAARGMPSSNRISVHVNGTGAITIQSKEQNLQKISLLDIRGNLVSGKSGNAVSNCAFSPVDGGMYLVDIFTSQGRSTHTVIVP